jgi:hypothetical protein
MGFARVDRLAEEIEFARFRRTGELGQVVGAAEIAGKPDAGEGGAEARRFAGDAQIAGERDAETRAKGRSVDCADDDFR